MTGAFVVAFILTCMIIAMAFWVLFFWGFPSYAAREFRFEDLSGRGGPASGTLYVTFTSDGPFAAGNPIRASSASVYVTTWANASGPIGIKIVGDTNASGAVQFQFPDFTTTFSNSHQAAMEIPRDAGQIIPSAVGRAGLNAHIGLFIEGWFTEGWARYFTSPYDQPEAWIDMGPSADLYTFLGLKATAAGLLVAAASQTFAAVESAKRLLRKERL